jgi:alpha-beta hydrolase superfamily lysophospholipase
MNTTAPSSPSKGGGTKVDPTTSKRIIRFVENLQQNDKEFQIFKNKLSERFNESKRPRNKLPALTTSFDATKIQ